MSSSTPEVVYKSKDEADTVNFELCQKVQKRLLDVYENCKVTKKLERLQNLERIMVMKKIFEQSRREVNLELDFGQRSYSNHYKRLAGHHFEKIFTRDHLGNWVLKDVGTYDSNSIPEKLKNIFSNKSKYTTKNVFLSVKDSRKTGIPLTHSNCHGCQEDTASYLNKFAIILLDLEVVHCMSEGNNFGEAIDETFYPLPVAVAIACMLDCINACIQEFDNPASCFDKYFNQENKEFHIFSGEEEDRVQAIKNIISEWFQKYRESFPEYQQYQAIPENIIEDLLKGQLNWEPAFFYYSSHHPPKHGKVKR